MHGGDPEGALPILHCLGDTYLQLGELKKACGCCERALALAEKRFGSQSIELVTPLQTLATIYFSLGFLDKCYRAAERALGVLLAAFGDDHVEVALARDRLGVALTEMGAYDRARDLHLQALAVLRGSGRHREIAAALTNIAATYPAAGDFERARALYEEALATARAGFGEEHGVTATCHALLGDYWAKAGDDGRALPQYRRALAIKRETLGELHPDIALLLFKIGRTEYRRDKATGRQILLEAIAVLDVRSHRPHLFAEICSFLAGVLAPRSAAIFCWKLAVNEIESLRTRIAQLDGVLERSFLRQNQDDFRALANALIALGRLPEAQHVLTMIKEHELFSLARIDARNTRVPLTVLEAHWVRRGWRILCRTHASLDNARRAVTAGESKTESLRAKIAAAGRDLDAVFEELLADFAASEAPPDRREALPAGSDAAASPANQMSMPGNALLQYVLMPDRRELCIILTKTDLLREFRVALGDGELNSLVFTMREALQNRSDEYLSAAQRLHALLIAPMLDVLDTPDITTLVLSLDGVLRYLPMAALHDGSRYLVERFALVLATHAVGARERNVARRRAAGLGVSQPLDGHQPLFGVRDELAAVVRIAGKRGGVLPGIIRLDRAFTAQAFLSALSSQYSVIHIASHFVFEAARESSSYLLLGDGSKLTLADFADLRFDAMDLVALSACNTAIGGGHHQNGHEIEGLGAVVRHQGANQVLATLWRVADITTAIMMGNFYRNRYGAGLAATEALRCAQLAALRGDAKSFASGRTRSLVDPEDEKEDAASPDMRHPFYWAPYILMGAPPQGHK